MDEQNLPSPENQAEIAKMVMVLMDHWQLDEPAQAAVLGISVETQLTLGQYRRGEFCASASPDQYHRILHLLDIHQKLRQLFPQNRELAYSWMTTRNKAFDNLTPAEMVGEQGVEGLLMIRVYLAGSLGASSDA
jgi:Protein of unknown function (DUF2384)